MKLIILTIIAKCYTAFAAAVSTGECSAYTATNTQGAVQNFADCEIAVMPGDILHISMCNSSTLNGDTYLRLFDPTDTVELSEGDDGCGGERGGTVMTYEVSIAYPNTGVTLHLHQGCFSTFSCGAVAEYSLNVEVRPEAHPTAAPADDDRYFDIRRCPLAACVDASSPAAGWNECDMCICEDFDKIFLSEYDHDCNSDEEYYMCMVKYHVQSGDIGGRITCTTRMKPGWVAAFFFIGLCGFMLFAGAFGFIFWMLCVARPGKPLQPVLAEAVRLPVTKQGGGARIHPEAAETRKELQLQDTDRDNEAQAP